MNRVARVLLHPYARLLFRLVVGGVFIYASIHKIQHPASFARAVSYYHLVPVEVLNVFALVVPWIELVAGAALIAGVLPRGSALLIGLLLALFIAAIGSALARGIDISCGCFSTEPGKGHTVGLDLVLQDLLLLAAVIPIIARGAGAMALDGRREARSP